MGCGDVSALPESSAWPLGLVGDGLALVDAMRLLRSGDGGVGRKAVAEKAFCFA